MKLRAGAEGETVGPGLAQKVTEVFPASISFRKRTATEAYVAW